MSFRHLRNVRGFFSDYYLGSVFGRARGRGARKRLSDRDTDTAYRRFRRIYEQAEGRVTDAATCRERFIRPLLRDVLGWHLGDGADRVHVLHASAEAAADGAAPLTLAYCGAWDEDLDAGKGHAPPARRIERAMAEAGLDHGFLITGERCRLARTPGDGPHGAYLEVDLPGLATGDDPESFAAFLGLFHVSRFVPGADGTAPIHAIERESREHAERVSEDLKRAVFTAAETLATGLLQDAQAQGGCADPMALGDSELLRYRDAALLALYRILFILYAEARDPRLREHRVYWDTYSVEGLIDELQRDPSRDWPENRCALWARLAAVFQIYDRGLPAITPWDNIPPRGGDFFSSDTAEGRILRGARLPDRTIARLLLDLTTTAPHRGIGRERVSFRELDIESLGAVYEGLLEFEPRVAREPTIETRVQGRVFALSPAELVRLCEEKRLTVRGDFAIVAGTAAEGLHPDAPSEEDPDDDEVGEEEEEDEEDEADEAEDEEPEADKGVKKGAAAHLLRRLDPGAFHFVPGPSRKGSGSFYTPRPLVRDLVRRSLEPLVAGRRAEAIEAVRVLDPACGSAHFLVEAMRFLGRCLHRTYVEEHGGTAPPHFRSTTGIGWDDNWRASDEEARAAGSEARAWCKRRIAERCLFGVDLNPTAVTLAQVALWIESLAGDRPLTYFAHRVRKGNSLLGTWRARLDQPVLPDKSWTHQGQADLYAARVERALGEAANARRLIDRAADEGAVEPDSIAELELKERLRREAEECLDAVHLLFDLRSASAFVPGIWADWSTLCSYISDPKRLHAAAAARPWWLDFETVRARERFFHWELEFPEVFLMEGGRGSGVGSSRKEGNREWAVGSRGMESASDPPTAYPLPPTPSPAPGFDAVLGNPPWDKVLPTKHEFYARYDVLIRAYKGEELNRRIREIHRARPGLEEAFGAYQQRTKIVAKILRNGGDFPLSEARSAAAHEDVSKYFLDRAIRLAAAGGRTAMLVPSVVYNGDGCVGIRRYLLHDGAIERFYGFENRKQIFPIHRSYKFVSLVFRKEGSRESGVGSREGANPTAYPLAPTPSFNAAFMRHDLAELEDDGPKPWMVTLTREEIERLSPETLAFLEYRSPRDQEIVHKMHRGRPTLGGDGPGAWGVTFFTDFAHQQIYNSARDKDLWTDPRTGRLYTPESILGPTAHSLPPTALLTRMREQGFWPVFEGKHIDQFLVGIKPVRWWLSVEAAERKYGKPPHNEPTLVFRETARNTDVRTCIAAVLPPASTASHKLSGVQPANVDATAAAAVLNSLCFDYALRLRTAGTNVSFTYMRPMPVPAAGTVAALPYPSTHLAWERAAKHVTDLHELWPVLWQANRAVAEAYDLTPDEFEHILDAFPVFARKRSAFVAYLRERLGEWRRTTTTERGLSCYASTRDESVPTAAEASAEFRGATRHRPSRAARKNG